MQGANQAIVSKMQILQTQNVQSSVSKVECYVCGKGLEDGYSITAKTLKHGIVLFCDIHYSLQSTHLKTLQYIKNDAMLINPR